MVVSANKETTSPSTKRVKRQKGVMRETLAPYKGTGLRLAAIDDNEHFSITTI